MRWIVLLLAVCIVLIAGLKFAVNAKQDPPSKEALSLVWLSIEALENAADHVEREDITKAEIADNLRLRAATVRVGLTEMGR